MPGVSHHEIGPEDADMRLDRWLVAQRPEQSRSRIQKFIEAGLVRVNGLPGRAKTPLRQGDAVELWMPPPEPVPHLVPQPSTPGRSRRRAHSPIRAATCIRWAALSISC